MNSIDIRKELHDYIEDADDRVLKLIYGLVLADKQENDIPEWHKQIIEERAEEYEKNPSGTISWEDLKATIEKMR